MGQDLILSLSRVALKSAGSEAGRSQGQPEVTSHIPELPQEIVEHILDQISPSKQHHVPENKETLQNCTLVCRRWLTRSSLCLFKCVAVSPKGVLRLLARAGTSERLKTYIQGIYIVHGTFVSVSPTQWLPDVFASFVHIQHLRLRYGVPEEAPDPFAMLHPRSQNLASLHLDDVAVSNLPACLRFFGNVGELVLRNVSGDVAPVAKPPHLLVRAISLEKSFPNCLSMLKAIVSPFMLTTLKIYVDSAQANGIVEALDDFLRELGGSIEHLSLHVGPGTKLSGELPALSQCYDLDTEDLEFSEPETAQYLMTDVLRYIPQSTKRVRLHCNPHYLTKMRKLSWLPLENCLDRCSGAVLDFCEVCKFSSLSEIQLMVEEKLPSRFRNNIRVAAYDLS